jgi:hypothetical protein
MKIRTILSPIDFSDLSARELAIAADVARAFGCGSPKRQAARLS